MTSITSLSLSELCRRIRSGDLSASEVVRAHHERAVTTGPGLNAFTELTGDGAGDSGPLRGIPIGVKDAFVDGGRVPTMGSRVSAAWLTGTAEVLERLRAAGATVLGYTNLHEWGIGTTSTVSATGPVRNPWDPERIAGGSSGGSAAAVAAGMVPASIGTDAAGSVRIPAACCGVVGLKPTFGTISLHGEAAAESELNTTGVIARTVEDVKLLFGLLAARAVADVGIAGLRLGVPSNFFFDDVQDEIRVTVERAVASLSGEIEIVAIPMEGVERAREVVSRTYPAFVAGLLEDELNDQPGDFQPATLKALRLGLERRAEPPVDGAPVRAAWTRAFAACDIVATPTLPAVTPRIDQGKIDLPSGPRSADLMQIAHNAPMNVAGVPALALPCGEVDGMPVSVTLSARHGAEDVLLSVGGALEERLAGAYSGRVAPDPAL